MNRLRHPASLTRNATISALAGVLAACLSPVADPPSIPLDPPVPRSVTIISENLLSGTPGWDSLINPTSDSFTGGFVSPFSVAAGDTLRAFVTSTSSHVQLSIYRLGSYEGVGARRVFSQTLSVPSGQTCGAILPGPLECAWHTAGRVPVEPGWTPGVYLAEFTDPLGGASGYPFVVRSKSVGGYLVVLPFNTYQAYNEWGGASLYNGPGGQRAYKVPFGRPLASSELLRSFLTLDYPFIRWLEEAGYNVSYITDYDLDRGRGVDLAAIAWLVAGHSEYWSWAMRQRAENARDAGISLGFMGGNDVYWNVRYERNDLDGTPVPILVCYKHPDLDPLGLDAGVSTTRYRDYPNRSPENELVGVMSATGLNLRAWPADLIAARSDSLFAGTGLDSGVHVPGLAGWEGDKVIDNGLTPPGIRILFLTPYQTVGTTPIKDTLEGTAYRWPLSGALVFASGDVGFQWGFANYRGRTVVPSVMTFGKNLMDAFLQTRLARGR